MGLMTVFVDQTRNLSRQNMVIGGSTHTTPSMAEETRHYDVAITLDDD